MDTMREPVSIIVLFFHRDMEKMPDNYDPQMMNDCIDSILQNSIKDDEIIAVDNGSTIDESWVKEHVDKYIRFEENMGISNGWNAGIQSARHDKVIILGDDTIVHDGWIESMLECFEREDCGAACPQVEGMPVRENLTVVWDWFPGACFMLSKSRTVRKVGYFDWKTYFPCNFEDTDMWVRIMAHGLRLYTNPRAYVQHRMGATLHVNDLSDRFEELKQKFIKKHGFDGQKYIYMGGDVREVLEKVDKTPIEPRVI